MPCAAWQADFLTPSPHQLLNGAEIERQTHIITVNKTQELRIMRKKLGILFQKLNDKILVGIQKMRSISLDQDTVLII